MKIAKTQATPVCQVACCVCEKKQPIGNVLADLDGEPFQAYYCPGCVPVAYRGEADDVFRALGATHYHDSMYPSQGRRWSIEQGTYVPQTWLFSRHYFNPEGTEIGLVIPDFFEIGGGVQVFEKPRVWGIPHDLKPLCS